MNRVLKLALCCVAAFGLLFSLAGCSSQSYTPPTKTAVVDTPTIGVSKTLRVGVNTANAPFASQVSGHIVGLDVDVAAAIADEMGLDLQIIDVGSDPQSAIASGEVDVVMGIDSSETGLSCWLSDPYVETSVALFAPEGTDSAPQAGSTPSIAAQGSSMSAWEVSNQFGDGAVVSAENLTTAFDALSNGSAQYVAADAVIGSYVVASSHLDAHMVALLRPASGYCIGVNSTNTALQQAVSTALQTVLGNGVIDVVQAKWLGGTLSLEGLPVTSATAAGGETEGSSSSSSTDGSSSGSSDDQTLDEVLAEGQNSSIGGSSSAGEAGANAVTLEEATGESSSAAAEDDAA